MRLLPPTLALLLVCSGCYTTRPVTQVDLRGQLRAGGQPLLVKGVEGESVRVDPNTDLRFLLRGGGATDWVAARDLWRSELGLSYEGDDGTYFVTWDEVQGVEVRNLSGGKTFAAVLLTTVIVGVAVVLIVASLKGGGGLNPGGGNSVGHGRSTKRTPRHRVIRHRLPRARGGVHVHVPLAILLSAAPPPDSGEYRDAPPPPPPPPPPAQEGAEQAVEINPPPEAKQRVEAVRLFEGSIRRRASVELIGNVAVGTEFVRFQGYSGTAMLGLRIRESFELAGGFRHVLAPLPPSRGDELDSGFIGLGRVAGHLWIDDRHWFALPIGVEAGAGHNVLFHARLHLGLRFSPLRSLWIGLLPFNPTFTAYKEDSDFDGALRWTFPSSLEVGFAF